MANVLVIDDERVIRDVIVEILEDDGHDVLGVATAEEGVNRLDDDALDLVVSDLLLPGLSGLDLLVEVQRRRPALPVILVTGAGAPAADADEEPALAAGLLAKPFSHAELRKVVAFALDRGAEAEL
jgi:DNA-binding NtrC family response regulator